MPGKSLSSYDRRRWFRGNSLISNYRYGITEQVLSITDIISEGPIQGLVHGGKSVYVNNDNLMADDDTGYTSAIDETVTYDGTAGSSTIVLNNNSGSFLYDTTVLGSRFLGVFDIISLSGDADATIKLTSKGNIDHKFNHTDIILNFEATTANFPYTTAQLDFLVATDDEEAQRAINDRLGVASLQGAGDRVYTCYIMDFTYSSVSETGTIKLRVPKQGRTPAASNRWLQNKEIEKFDISITQFLDIQSFSGGQFVTSSPAGYFSNKRFLITQNLDTTVASKYRGASYQFRSGTVDQAPIQSLYGVGSTSVALTPPGEMNRGATKTITASGAQASEIDLVNIVFNYPGGLYASNTDNGDKEAAGAGYKITATFYSSPEDQTGTTVIIPGDLEVTSKHLQSSNGRVPLSGASVAVGEKIHSHGGKYASPITFNHVIDLEPYQPFAKFTLNITRLTNDQNMTDTQEGRAHTYGQRNNDNDSTRLLFRDTNIKKYQAIQSGSISQVVGVIKEKLNYPYTALGNVTFSAKSFSDAPTRTYECYGMKVLVPDNYITREQAGKNADGSFKDVKDLYTGIWTGSFRSYKVYTDNPAWIFYDILSNNRYGIGEFIDEDVEIDKYSLYKIARYCDELVPDGSGGLEPRFRANYYFQKATDIYKVLKDMASTFRGMLYWMDGQIVPVIDEKKSPVYAFNSSNVFEGAFEYESTGAKTRTNQVVVSWNNPESDYKLEPLIIEDRENIIKTGSLIKETANAFGCTSQGQAIRYGRWKLWTAINQTEIVTFKTSINAAFLKPGDIVTIQDNHDHGYTWSGRVSSVESNKKFTLDRPLTDHRGVEFSDVDMAGKEISILTFGRKIVLGSDPTADIGGTTYSRGDVLTSAKDEDGNTLTFPTGGEVNIDSLTSGTIYKIIFIGTATQSAFQTASGEASRTFQVGDVFTAASSVAGSTAKVIPAYEAYINNAYDDDGNILDLQYEEDYLVKDYTIETAANDGYNPNTNQIITTENIWANTAEGVGTIWGIKDTSVVSPKEYKIMSISHENDTTYAIVAVEYYESKFDAVDIDFTLSTPDTSDPPEPTEIGVPSPKNLRVLKDSTYTTAGDEFTVQWDSPTLTGSSENIVVTGYELEHTVPGYDSPLYTTDNSYSFEGIVDGIYYVEVRSISRAGRKSSPASSNITVQDIFGGNYDRIFGVLQGGKVGSKNATVVNTEVNPSIYQFKFDDSPVAFMSPVGGINSVTINNSSGEIDVKPLVAGRDADWFSNANTNQLIAKDRAYVLQKSGNLYFVNHAFDSALGMEYWYDQLEYNKYLWNENEALNHYPNDPTIWEVISNGTVTIEENSNKIVGSGGYFTNGGGFSNFSHPDILKFDSSQAARISFVESDSVAYLDRSFDFGAVQVIGASFDYSELTVTYSAIAHTFKVGDSVIVENMQYSAWDTGGKKVVTAVTPTTYTQDAAGEDIVSSAGTFTVSHDIGAGSDQTAGNYFGQTASKKITSSSFEKQSIQIDFTRDHLIGFLAAYTGSFNNFCFLDPDIQPGRSLTVDLNPAFIRFSGAAVPTQITDSGGGPVYDQISLTARALNFTSPEFIVSGNGFNDVSANAPTTYSAEIDGEYTLILDDGTNLLRNGNNGWQNGNTIDFTVTARESGDQLNPDKTISTDVSIFRIQDGSIGISGRTVFLNSEDYSILFDEGGDDPEYNGSSDSEIDLTADFNNFDDAIYRVTLKRPTGLGGSSESVTLYDWTDATTDSISFVYAEGTGTSQWNPIYNDGYTPPRRQWPATIIIEAAEKPDGWTTGDTVNSSDIKATDSVSIAGVKKSSGGLSLILSNETHSYTTDKFGDIGTGSTAIIPNSGTTLEVLVGGEVGNYVGKSDATGLPTTGAITSDDDLADKDWYIVDIEHEGGDLSLGAVSANFSTNIITIADHTMTNSAIKDPNNTNPTDDTEAIEYTIKVRNGQGPASLRTISKVQSLSKSIAGIEGAVFIQLYLLSATQLQSSSVDYPTMAYTFSDGTISISDTNQSWTSTYPSFNATNKYIYQLSTRVLPGDTTDTVTVSDAAANWDFALLAEFADVGEDARSIKLDTTDGFVIRYDQSGAKVANQSITLTTQSRGTDPNNSLFYVFSINGSAAQNGLTDGTNSSSFVLDGSGSTHPALGSTISVKVELYEGATAASATEVAQDTVTIFAVKEGSNAVTAFLTNESHVVPASSAGVIDSAVISNGLITNAGGTFKVFVGATEVTTDCTFSVGTETTTGLLSIGANTGIYTVAATDSNSSQVLTTDSATSELSVVIPSSKVEGNSNVTLTKTYSISKSKDGDDAANSATVPIYTRTNSNTAPTSATANGWPSGNSTYTFSDRSLTFTTANGWSSAVPSSGGDYLWTTFATALGTGLTDTIPDTEWASPATLLSSNGLDGAAVNIAFIRKATTPTVGTGTGALPNGESNPSWTDDAPADNGLPLWATKGNRAQGSTAWSWDQAPFKVDGSAAAEIYFYSNATTGNMPAFSAPTYNFANSSTTAPTNWNLSPPSLTADGQKIYVKVVLYVGTPAATSVSATTVSADDVIYAQRTDGTPGTKTALVYAYKKSTNAPSISTDNPGAVTVSLTTGKITTTSLANNWYKEPQQASNTQPIWVTAATASGTGSTDTIAANEWASAVQFTGSQGGTGNPGIDSLSLVLQPSVSSVTYAYDGTNWDPSSTSITVTAVTSGYASIQSYSWSGSVTGTASSATLNLSSNLTESQVDTVTGEKTFSVTVTGTNSAGTTNQQLSASIKVPVSKAASGASGESGFFYIKRTTTSLTAPSNSEVPNPVTGTAAVVENSAGTQAGFVYGNPTSNQWNSVELISTGIIRANAITADQLLISNDTSSSTDAGIYLNYNGGSPKIEIRATNGGNPVVTLGYLS